MMTKKAIAVLSGGLDSCVATCVYAEDYEIHGITFNYGQKSFKQELKASEEICRKMGFTHEVIDLPWLNKISNSSLTSDNEIPTLTHEELDDLDICEDTASSVWVPGRNIVFTSIATSYAESIGARLYHYRENDTGIEVDAIIEIGDGEYGAIEIKLGANKEEEAVASLKRFYELAEVKPKFMCVICGLYNAVVKRPDGIYVLPITALRP